MSLLIGTDPEFFIVNPKTKEFKSSIGVLRGTKTQPQDLGKGYSLFSDNVLAEMNIPAAPSRDQLLDNIGTGLNKLQQVLGSSYYFSVQASGYFPEQELQSEEAKKIGCEPEYCAYELAMVPKQDFDSNFRSAGGHIHLGYSEDEFPLRGEDNFSKIWVIRMLDLFLGIPSLWLDTDPSSVKRRSLYGSAGTHRPKVYGVEYRATSNFWLCNPTMTGLIWDICEFTVNFVKEEKHLKLWEDMETCKAYDVELLKQAINQSSKEKAEDIFTDVALKYLPSRIKEAILLQTGKRHIHNSHDVLSTWGKY